MRLPHNPGQLSNRSWSSSSRPISQDLTRGVIVGQDNYTGRAIAFDGSGTVAADSDIEPELGAGVDIVRPNSVEKARSTTLRWITRTLRSPGGGSFTNSQPSEKDIKSCGESESGGPGSGGGGFRFPTPPEDPPEPPEEVVEEVNSASVSAPRACQPKPPTIVRPRQQDSYYYVDSIDAPCPLGMTKYGYAELPNGDIMIQCKSPAPPPSGGVPSDPTAWGYDCSSCGTCIPVQGGKYPTLEICQQSGCKPMTYQCTPTGCVPVYDGSGNFTTLAACENSCSAVPYACVDGNCIQTLDGKYATLEDCQANCSSFSQIKIEVFNPHPLGNGNRCMILPYIPLTYVGKFLNVLGGEYYLPNDLSPCWIYEIGQSFIATPGSSLLATSFHSHLQFSYPGGSINVHIGFSTEAYPVTHTLTPLT